MRILQKILGLFGLTVVKRKRKGTYVDYKGVKYVRFTKE